MEDVAEGKRLAWTEEEVRSALSLSLAKLTRYAYAEQYQISNVREAYKWYTAMEQQYVVINNGIR